MRTSYGFGVGGLGRGGGALCRSLARGRTRRNRAPNEGAQMKGDRAEQRDNRLPDSAVPEAGAGRMQGGTRLTHEGQIIKRLQPHVTTFAGNKACPPS